MRSLDCNHDTEQGVAQRLTGPGSDTSSNRLDVGRRELLARGRFFFSSERALRRPADANSTSDGLPIRPTTNSILGISPSAGRLKRPRGSGRCPLLPHGHTPDGRPPVFPPVWPGNWKMVWLVQPGGIVVRVGSGNAVIGQKKVPKVTGSEGDRIGNRSAGRDHGLLRHSLTLRRQHGRKAQDPDPVQLATSAEYRAAA